MKQFFNLLKATTKGDLNIFKFDVKNKGTSARKGITTFLLIIFLLASVGFSIGFYAYSFAEPLSKVNLTYVALSIFMLVSVVIVFSEGIYKSQGILFDAKDNDMLFSMPLKRSTILSVRICKLLFFQYVFTFMFAIPALIVYVYFENPGVIFYIASIIMLLVLPIIPTILGCVVGYIIKASSSVFKNKKAMQTILSLVLTLLIFLFSFKMESFITNIVSKAQGINDVITKIYYPIGLYINSIQDGNILNLFYLIIINVVLAILYVYIFSSIYFKIISKSSENSVSSSKKKAKIKTTSALNALVKKELKQFFSSPIYIFNTVFGLVLVVIFVFNFLFNKDNTINTILQTEGLNLSVEQIMMWFSKLYIALLLVVIPTVAITASSISLEGKTFYILKSAPVKTSKIFIAKILTSNIICIPILLICSAILIIAFKFTMLDSLFIFLICLIFPTLTAILGLIINLTFPLMNAKSDTVIVKQSKSALFAILFGYTFGIAPVVLFFAATKYITADLYVSLIIAFYFIVTCILWRVLNTYGVKKFKEI